MHLVDANVWLRFFLAREHIDHWRRTMSSLQEMVDRLPPQLQREVEDFARFLAERHRRAAGRPLRLDWAGGLSDLKGEYDSGVELQKKALAWRGD